jgi:DNA mismatch endonuclease (patch repair protein)
VFPKYQALVFVHGCFWHKHDCRYFKWPKTRAVFWRDKIQSNTRRDKRTLENYKKTDWRILIVWECTLRGKYAGRAIARIEKWLLGKQKMLVID